MRQALPIRFLGTLTWAGVLATNLHCGSDRGASGSDADFRVPPAYSGKAKVLARGAGSTQIVYLNFDGGVISNQDYYGDESQTNSSFIPQVTATIPAFDSTEFHTDRAAAIASLVAFVSSEYQAYGIRFTTARPSSGNYTMMMIGGTPEAIGETNNGILGVSPLDIGNWNPNDVGFVFSQTLGSYTSDLRNLGYVICHETGHTVGLQHVTPLNDIMSPTLGSGLLIWGVGPLSENPSQQQDDKAVLLANLGSSSAIVPKPTATPIPTPIFIPTPLPTPVTTPKVPAPNPIATPVPSGDPYAQQAGAWYATLVGAAPSAASLETWATQLRSGSSAATVLSEIYGTSGFFQHAGGKYTYFVAALYRDVRGASPSAAWSKSALSFLKASPGVNGRTTLAYRLLTQ